MKKQPKILIVIFIVIVLSILLVPYILKNESFSITTLKVIEPRDINVTHGLSFDGSKIYISFTKYYDIESDKIQDNMAAFENMAPGARQFLSISPQDRFMTAGDISNSFIFDFAQNDYQEFGFLCKSWSFDSTRCIDINGTLIEISSGTKIETWDKNVDFNTTERISGNGDYLWDMEKNIPIAFFSPCPITELGTGNILETSCKLLTPSLDFNQQSNGIKKDIFTINPSNTVVDWTFDPSGKFILLAIWERTTNNIVLDYDSDENVIDTQFVVIDWRTGETFELFRLSEIMPDYPISLYYSNMQWSSDGSTLFLPLNGGNGFILAKIEYP